MESGEASSDEVWRDFRRVLSAVESGGVHMIVKRYGIPAAVIVPVAWHERAKAALAQGENP
jgi:antitoxin (DNA-binding transcriptional repressor) of toxin-antitoxin stability system